jgi:hypothetical protein
MPTYEYTGDADVVFPTLAKDGQTWTASKGDTIDSDVELSHPSLSLVTQVAAKNNESPKPVDESEEN